MSSITRIWTGEVWVRRSAFLVDEEGVLHVARRVVGRKIERFEVVVVVLDLRSVRDRQIPSETKIRLISSRVCVSGCFAADESRRAGKCEVERAAIRPRAVRCGEAASRSWSACTMRPELVEALAESAACLGRDALQLLEQLRR